MNAYLLQAIESAVAAAVLDATEQAVYKEKDNEATQAAAQQAAAETQALRKLEDRCEALQEQLEQTANGLHSAETQLR